MDTALRPATTSPVRTVLIFAGCFLLLFASAVAIAERTVGRAGTDSAFQKLFAAQGTKVDWLVLGASHALPLNYGDVPARLQQDTGQSMLVLAEIGAGPLYNRFVFDQALRDLDIKHLIYVIDSFAFFDKEWNETRMTDRALLRRTPLRLSTARILTHLSLENLIDPRGLLDYLTGFSKLNPVERFPQDGWQGAANFDRQFRPSRHATAARMAYLYPHGVQDIEMMKHYLDTLDGLFDVAKTAGIDVVVVKLPIPDDFRASLPAENAFDAVLRDRLASRGVAFHDLSQEIGNPSFYFDTDHLNANGVDALYRDHLLALLSAK